MKRACSILALLPALAGCLWASDKSLARGVDCFSVAECGGDSICFLGRCVDPGFGLSGVQVEARPPAGSGLLVQHYPTAVDAGAGFAELTLQRSVIWRSAITFPDGGTTAAFAGLVRASLTSKPGCATAIPGRKLGYEAVVAEDGTFRLEVPPGSYDLTFIPGGSEQPLPPLELTAGTACGAEITVDANPVFHYPALQEQTRISGKLSFNEQAFSPVGGATVVGLGVTPDGLVSRSAPATTDGATGQFELTFARAVVRLTVNVRPGSNTMVPEAGFPNLVPDAQNALPPLILGITGSPRQMTVVVEDVANERLAGATVIFDGQVGLGRALATQTSGADGTVTASLLPGTYSVTAVPPASGPWAIAGAVFELKPESEVEASLPIMLLPKTRVTGVVRTSDSQPLAGARLSFTLRDSPTPREFSAVSDAEGRYTVLLDPAAPSTGQPAEYVLIVEPPAESSEPRHRALLRVSGMEQVYDIALFAPTFVYGRVVGPAGAPLANTVLTFFSEALSDGEQPFVIGIANTSASGEFATPLPTPR